MKTTAEAAAELGIKPDKLRRILKTYPSYAPTEKFNGGLVWLPADIAVALKIVEYVEEGICPHCGTRPEEREEPAEKTPDVPA